MFAKNIPAVTVSAGSFSRQKMMDDHLGLSIVHKIFGSSSIGLGDEVAQGSELRLGGMMLKCRPLCTSIFLYMYNRPFRCRDRM